MAKKKSEDSQSFEEVTLESETSETLSVEQESELEESNSFEEVADNAEAIENQPEEITDDLASAQSNAESEPPSGLGTEKYEESADRDYSQYSLGSEGGNTLRGLSKKLFARNKPVSPNELEVDSEPEEDVLDEKALKKRIRAANSEIKSLENELAERLAETDKTQEDLAEAETAIEKLETWTGSQQDSFFWRLKQKMSANQQSAQADLETLESQVKSLDLPEAGTLIDMRTRFHNGLKTSFLAALIPIGLLIFIAWASENEFGSRLTNALSNGWVISALVIVLAIFSGFWFLLRRGLKANQKNVPWKKLLMQLLVIFLIIGLLAFFIFFPDFMRDVVGPIVRSIMPLTITLILISLFFALLGLTISYYSKWSEYRRTVVEQYAKLDNVVNGYVKTKQEIVRIDGLYKQLTDWVELVAHSVYRPWAINPDWKSKESFRSEADNMPRALRVAQAVESDPADTARLERKISQLLMTPGWRSQAFSESLEAISRMKGLTSDALSTDRLERDLPHQPNNSRELVLDEYRSLASGYEPGFLEQVAKHRVEELASKSQVFALSEAQPQVEQLVEDPLRVFLGSQLEESSTVITSEWDEFLSKGLSLSEDEQPPLSPLTFTEDGIMVGASSPMVFVLAPDKVAEKLTSSVSKSVSLMGAEPSSATPRSEIVLRVDVSKPTMFENVHLISKAVPGLALPTPTTPTSPEDQDL